MMDNLVKDKIGNVVKALEKINGGLRLLAFVWRVDVKKWDIVFSADWVDYNKLQESIGKIFDAFKIEFNGEFALRFTGIYPLAPQELFVKQLNELFPNPPEAIEIKEIQIGDVRIDEMFLVISKPVASQGLK